MHKSAGDRASNECPHDARRFVITEEKTTTRAALEGIFSVIVKSSRTFVEPSFEALWESLLPGELQLWEAELEDLPGGDRLDLLALERGDAVLQHRPAQRQQVARAHDQSEQKNI